MARLTTGPAQGGYRLDTEAVSPAEGGWSGPAVERLAAFENLWEQLTTRYKEIPAELERLRGAGKKNTAQFRELMGQKLLYGQMLTLLALHGIDEG